MALKNNKKNFAIVVGARPNFMKVAPLLIRGKKYPYFKFTLIHTGQHFDESMSKVFFDELGLPEPDIFLKIKSGSHTEKIGKMFSELRDFFSKNRFDAVLVVGDVNSTLAAALAAAKNNQNLIHIEAGLRSFDRRMPEEINRVIVDHLSDLLFTTEPSANENLIREGMAKNQIKYVGNLMIESIELYKKYSLKSNVLKDNKLAPREYVVATIHRQENTDDKNSLTNILNILNQINEDRPVVIPMHPGTKNKISNFKLDNLLGKLTVIEPLGYFDFMNLVMNSGGVITDSGGIQEETSHLGIPCCTLRDNTERPITLVLGSNKLFSIIKPDIRLMKSHLSNKNFKKKNIPLWDSSVSKRILEILKLSL